MARKATKNLVEQDYSALDAYCIGMYEFAQSLKRAGFDEETVLGIIVESSPKAVIQDLSQKVLQLFLLEKEELSSP
jgi:hypothetical protein